MSDFENMLTDLCKMNKSQLVQMVLNTDEVEIMLHLLKGVLGKDYVGVLRCKVCKYGSYDSKSNGAMVCLRTKDGFWRKETDFCSYGEYQTNTGGAAHE